MLRDAAFFARSLATLTTMTALLAPGCGGDSADAVRGTGGSGGSGGSGAGGEAGDANDVAGDYTVTIVNGTTDCSTLGEAWVVGRKTTDVGFVIEQDGTLLTAEATGNNALPLVVLTGNPFFAGSVHGSAFTLRNVGDNPQEAGECSFTVDAIVEGVLAGDQIQGTLTYRPAISDNPDCAPYDCRAEAGFSGVRPPRS